ncbi:TPA: hypothetical protein RG722_001809 [Morganella morganii subsp. morganii]|uniref:helix-turn-helix domain-containing protein n=1 Tax=Morganella morganii TaxID=582 RepID=UPI000684A92C|nr:hypothetical protein [Morganella morganii]HDU8650696.1 hypothetical protein [Morganella morganii subsp. morganii]
MNSKKNDSVSFPDVTKATFKDRLKALIGDRSVRGAARDWNLSVSTLNNYLNRGTEPTLSVLNTISNIENVSVDWLVKGQSSATETAKNEERREDARQAWMMIYDSLSSGEAESIMRAIHRHGVLNAFKINHVDYIEHSEAMDAIDAMHIRPTLKQAIRLAMAGDESLDQEILRRIEEKKNTDETGHLSQEEDHQKVG